MPYLHWNQNGKQRVWNLSMPRSTSKLRKALKKCVDIGSVEYLKLVASKNIADLHHAIYGLVGTPEFLSFEIKSEG